MKVNEKFPNWLTSGGNAPADFTGFISNLVYPYYYAPDKPVFRYAYSDKVFPSVTVGTNAPWLSSLDVMFAMRFGERRLRNIVDALKFHNKSTETITSEEQRNTVIMAQMINERFADKWNHIADALGIAYNPLENYNRIEDSSFENNSDADNYDSTRFGYRLDETTSGDVTVTTETLDNRFDKKSIKGGWADNDTRSTETSGGYTKEVVDRDSVHGFNGTSGFDEPGSPSEYSKTTETVNYNDHSTIDAYKETQGGAITRDYHGKLNDTVDPDYTENESRNGSEYTKHHIDGTNSGWNYSEISGNIGTVSSQDMLFQELEVRRNILYDIVLNDIAEFLTISIY